MNHLLDGYLLQDLIVFRGLQKGGFVGKGFRVQPPDYENAEVAWLNRFEDDLRVLLTSLKDNTRLQIQWAVDSDYKRELLAYYENTKNLARSEWSRRQRNERFTRYWEHMERRELRRERLHLYVTTKVEAHVGPPTQGKRALYQYLLDTSARELRQYGELFEQIFRGLGGSVEPLDDAGHFREFYRFFNASASDQPNLDYKQLFDPEQTIVENCFNGEAVPLAKPDLGFYLDGYYHGLLVIKSLPKATFSGMISQLTSLDMLDYGMTVNIRALDIMREIEREEGAYEKLQHTIQHSPKLRMVAAMQKKSQKIARLMSNEVLPYQAQFILHAWDQDKAGLRAKLAALRSAIGKMNGAKYYDPALPTSARNYFYASLPGWSWSKYDDFSHYIEDVNLANLLPISATPTGDLSEAEAIYDGANRNLIGVRTFAGRKDAPCPQHGVMFGMSGAGKSVNMVDLLTQTEPYYEYTVIVEEGLSYAHYTRSIAPDAKPIILQPNGNLTFNYLDTLGLPLNAAQVANASALGLLLVGGSEDRDKGLLRAAQLSSAIRQLYRDFQEDWARKHPEKMREIVAHALRLRQRHSTLPPGSTFLEAFVADRDDPCHDPIPFDDGLLEQAMHDPTLSEDVHRLTFAYLTPSEMPTHGHLRELLSLESHGVQGQELRHLATLLEPWCAGGNYGPILDGINNVDLRGAMTHFELGYIPESAEDLRAVAAFLITNHVRNEVITRPRKARKRVVLEELSAFLNVPNGERITREFYERMRKFHCWVISVIQQYSRFRESAVRSSVMGNSRLLLLLKQRDRLDLEHIGESFPLAEVTKATISTFPEPSRSGPNAYSGFVYYRVEDEKPVIAVGRNVLAKEMMA